MGPTTTRSLSPTGPSLAKAAKVTICHAAGLAGTTKYIAIVVSANATGGHFENDGTPKAGHEDDRLGVNGLCPDQGTLQICVAMDGGVVDPNVPAFLATLTARLGSDPAVLTKTFSGFAALSCSDVVAVAVGTYRVDHPAPGVADPPPPDNGTWFVESVGGTIDGVPVVLVSLPANGVTWGAVTGRGAAAWADVPVQSLKASVVTFNDKK